MRMLLPGLLCAALATGEAAGMQRAAAETASQAALAAAQLAEVVRATRLGASGEDARLDALATSLAGLVRSDDATARTMTWCAARLDAGVTDEVLAAQEALLTALEALLPTAAEAIAGDPLADLRATSAAQRTLLDQTAGFAEAALGSRIEDLPAGERSVLAGLGRRQRAIAATLPEVIAALRAKTPEAAVVLERAAAAAAAQRAAQALAANRLAEAQTVQSEVLDALLAAERLAGGGAPPSASEQRLAEQQRLSRAQRQLLEALRHERDPSSAASTALATRQSELARELHDDGPASEAAEQAAQAIRAGDRRRADELMTRTLEALAQAGRRMQAPMAGQATAGSSDGPRRLPGGEAWRLALTPAEQAAIARPREQAFPEAYAAALADYYRALSR